MKRVKWKTRKGIWEAAFMAPAVILFFIFTYYPLLINVSYSFTSWNGMTAEKTFVGLQNFIAIFKDPGMGQAVKNTIYFTVVLLIMGIALQLSAALIIYNRPKGHNFIKVILYLPVVLSPIVVSYTWIQFLQYTGYINQLLEALGQGAHSQNWLLNEKTVKLWLCVIQSFQYTGYGMIFYLTGLNSVPTEIYESAELDGARGFKKFWHITLPLIMPSITVTMFISITGALNTYAIPYALTKGGPNNASTTITMQIYQRAFGFKQFGYASAMSILYFIVIAAVGFTQLWYTRKKEVEY